MKKIDIIDILMLYYYKYNIRMILAQQQSFDNRFPELIHEIYRENYGFTQGLEELHSILDTNFTKSERDELIKIQEIGVSDRKSVFLKNYYHFVDSNSDFSDYYQGFIREYILPLFPEETALLYQATPNLRISFPGSSAIGRRPATDPSEDIIGLHTDGELGHGTEEVNFIVPITNMFGTNSIYYENTVDSSLDPYDYENLVLVNDHFFQCQFNKLKHYNRINDTGKTRISLDLRVIPSSKYKEDESITSFSAHKKMKLGGYFNIMHR